jgi:hypothetical protein
VDRLRVERTLFLRACRPSHKARRGVCVFHSVSERAELPHQQEPAQVLENGLRLSSGLSEMRVVS